MCFSSLHLTQGEQIMKTSRCLFGLLAVGISMNLGVAVAQTER